MSSRDGIPSAPNELKTLEDHVKHIDNLRSLVVTAIANNDYENVLTLNVKKEQALKDLFAHPQFNDHTATMLPYLQTVLAEHDAQHQKLAVERDQLKSAITNMGSVKKYVE